MLVSISSFGEIRGKIAPKSPTLLSAKGPLQTLYIFFGVAVLVGVLTGTSLHYASGFLITILKLESQATEQRERTLATYRAEKLEKLEEAEPLLKLQSEKESETNIDVTLRRELADWTWGKQQQDRRKRGLIPTTILEEEDSSEGGL